MRMHRFFDYVIVIEVWKIISSLTSIDAQVTYESVARWWVSNKKNQANNLVHTATWAIWRCRNDLCFNKNTWPLFTCDPEEDCSSMLPVKDHVCGRRKRAHGGD
jgi:hypothetical protein